MAIGTNQITDTLIPTTGELTINGSLSLGAVVTKTGDFTLADTENWIICNKTTSDCVVTLPTASSQPGRMIVFNNYAGGSFAVVSDSSNIVPWGGGAAQTEICPSAAVQSTTIVSDGTNWVIMQRSA